MKTWKRLYDLLPQERRDAVEKAAVEAAGAVQSDFSAVGNFHRKFNLPTREDGPPQELTTEQIKFRLGFLLEELSEICDGYGLKLVAEVQGEYERPQNLAKVADGLVDLVYVALGTAQMHRLPWERLFAEVQRTNMSKERCGINHQFDEQDKDAPCGVLGCGKPRAMHSLRGSALDVIKPESFQPPAIVEILAEEGWPGPPLFRRET